MIKLKNISLCSSVILNESDYYVNINILFQKANPYDGVCYWYAYGKSSSLVEICLSNPTGAIRSIVLFVRSIIKHYITSDEMIIGTGVVETIGFPLFETYIEKYELGYYHLDDENIDFHLYISEKNITILISLSTVILHVINDRIVFGFDKDNHLCYIHIKNAILNDEGFLELISA